MNREERVVKYINSSDDFVVNGKRYCENDFYNDVEDLAKENKKYKEVIDKAKTKLEQGITFCENDSQGVYDKCNIAINREQRILDILKEVE